MTAPEKDPKTSLAVLESAANMGYGKQPLPSARDQEIRALLESANTAELSKAVTLDHARVLRVFAERAASLAVRRQDAQSLRIGLIALGLADPASRETILILPLYYDAAERLELDARWLFGSAGNSLGDAAARQLAAFPDRSPQDRSLQSMGYRAQGEGAQFCYVREW